jgi:hypothetical protein
LGYSCRAEHRQRDEHSHHKFTHIISPLNTLFLDTDVGSQHGRVRISALLLFTSVLSPSCSATVCRSR